MMSSLLTVALVREEDLVAARQRARQIGALLGFGHQDQIRIATTVSEVARNALRYAGGGRAQFSIRQTPGATGPASRRMLIIEVADRGPGIANLDDVLAGRYVSSSGMGQGLVGARRLMDFFDIRTSPGEGTQVTLGKLLPADAPALTPPVVAEWSAELTRSTPTSSLQELQRQNGELIATLDTLRERQEELERLTHELEDTNRGVVALYAELDEQAERLRHADDMKSRFLSNMSHEFRTPLSSVRALSRLLLTEVDGPLSHEQRQQVLFIDAAASELSQLVNDLLDLAKIEAGQVAVHAVLFDVTQLFSALRGMLKPLLVSDKVELVFEPPVDILAMVGDESKVAQIMRNFISNALKFTPAGEVRVSCGLLKGKPGWVELAVSDTGIGLAHGELDLIFEEFKQVENELQHAYKGTGLGLPLCKKLAGLMGGLIHVVSEPGKGARFSVELPLLPEPAAAKLLESK